jgi:hypothetical protein
MVRVKSAGPMAVQPSHILAGGHITSYTLIPPNLHEDLSSNLQNFKFLPQKPQQRGVGGGGGSRQLLANRRWTAQRASIRVYKYGVHLAKARFVIQKASKEQVLSVKKLMYVSI